MLLLSAWEDKLVALPAQNTALASFSLLGPQGRDKLII
jgi:hypothetical protein